MQQYASTTYVYIYIYTIREEAWGFSGTQFKFIVCNFDTCYFSLCFVFFPWLDNIWNQFNMRTTYLGYVVRRWFFSPNSKTLLWGSLAQISPSAASTPGSGQSSGGFWCRYLVRFRRGSGADTSWGSGGFRWRLLVRFRRVPLKIPAEAPEGSVRFRKFPVQEPGEVPEVSGAATWWRRVPGQIPCEAPEGSGAETLWGSGRFWQRRWLSEVPEGFRCRYLVRFRRVLVQMLCEIPKGFDFLKA